MWWVTVKVPGMPDGFSRCCEISSRMQSTTGPRMRRCASRSSASRLKFALEVSNAGTAIDAETLVQFFEPLKRSTTKEWHDGLGLGLYIVREIAKTSHFARMRSMSRRMKSASRTFIPFQGRSETSRNGYAWSPPTDY